jgi:FrmR/RcnR family transcriptional regulator, repressor of frmRAB operon
MTHVKDDKKKLFNRVHRIHGQLHAVEKALEEEKDPSFVLQTLVAAHGAMKSLIAEIIEHHIRSHITTGKQSSDKTKATEELIHIMRTYLK